MGTGRNLLGSGADGQGIHSRVDEPTDSAWAGSNRNDEQARQDVFKWVYEIADEMLKVRGM